MSQNSSNFSAKKSSSALPLLFSSPLKMKAYISSCIKLVSLSSSKALSTFSLSSFAFLASNSFYSTCYLYSSCSLCSLAASSLSTSYLISANSDSAFASGSFFSFSASFCSILSALSFFILSTSKSSFSN